MSEHGVVATSLKYAVVERERRFLVNSIPEGVVESIQITDRYVEGSRLRLREMVWPDGRRVRKLGHKVRLTDGPAAVACTSMYLDDAEWALLRQLPARTLQKVRHRVSREDWQIAVDQLEDGTLLAEIDDGDTPSSTLPAWLDIATDVSADERWTGAALAR
ncbi:hypothetical protein [Allobranchiibius sp. GilTou73]|uniref:hypothetical protein n=1 Tax=Allobranchiibius sp. GilTou73 TaxID=2904523 RepID=UPI001F2097F7|nr:hypothetical protein [Allobranchiibius sp. GilTou73]UIJ35507.1 hypothetical protein LVQ62_03705 [Allobranchiibius sp. GilTou73]